jgi:hypothetical protein
MSDEQIATNKGSKATKSRPTGRKKKISAAQQRYDKAIALSDAALGATVKAPSERITQHVDKANAHDVEAKKERAKAQREFEENLAYFYEIKQRLLNPGYRTDVNGGRERTLGENEKNFGAPDWAAFRKKNVAYSLQHADRKLREFAKTNGLQTDDGKNSEDTDSGGSRETRLTPGRRTNGPSAQKGYTFSTASTIDIDSQDPQDGAKNQIRAATEHMIPVPADLITKALSLLSDVSERAADSSFRARASQILVAMRLHGLRQRSEDVPAVVAAEEKGKLDGSLEKKNGQPLWGPASVSGADGTSEHVQRSNLATGSKESKNARGEFEEYGLRKARQKGEHKKRMKSKFAVLMASLYDREAASRADLASHNTSHPGAAQTQKPKITKKPQPPMKPPKVKRCPPDLSPEAQEHIRWMETVISEQPGARQGDYVLNELGKWEFDPEVSGEGMHETMNAPQAAVYPGSTTQPALQCTT